MFTSHHNRVLIFVQVFTAGQKCHSLLGSSFLWRGVPTWVYALLSDRYSLCSFFFHLNFCFDPTLIVQCICFGLGWNSHKCLSQAILLASSPTSSLPLSLSSSSSLDPYGLLTGFFAGIDTMVTTHNSYCFAIKWHCHLDILVSFIIPFCGSNGLGEWFCGSQSWSDCFMNFLLQRSSLASSKLGANVCWVSLWYRCWSCQMECCPHIHW